MSYILDALKKAERERHLAQIPTLETVHRAPSAPRHRIWPWIAALVLLLNGTVLIWVLRPAPTLLTGSPTGATGKPAAQAPAPPAEPPTQALPADRARRMGPHEKPASVAASPSQPAPPSSGATATARPQPERKPATTTKATEAKPPASAALAPPAPTADLQRPKPVDSPTSPTPPAVAPEQPAAPAAPPASPVAAAPEKPAAPPAAPSPVKPAERSARALPLLQDMPQAVQEVVPKMRLEVLVYSDDPSDRLVFINSHKYLEGQSIDGKIVVERITPDGAVLNYQGRRFMLRQ